jgi:SH3 domain protein
MCKGLLATLPLFLFCQLAVAAQSVYVNDTLRLGVRKAPSTSENSIAVVTTGDRLTVLGEQETFLKVRTDKGVEGWVSKAYVSEEAPAKLRLEALQQRHERLSSEMNMLQQQLAQTRQKEAASQQRLTALRGENAALNQRLSTYVRITEEKEAELGWLYQSVSLLLLFLVGVFLGVRWHKGRVAERIGGLQL